MGKPNTHKDAGCSFITIAFPLGREDYFSRGQRMARQLEFLLLPKKYHESNLIMRASVGKLWIVTADNAAPEATPVSSPGGIVSPDGEWIVKAADIGEQFYCSNIGIL